MANREYDCAACGRHVLERTVGSVPAKSSLCTACEKASPEPLWTARGKFIIDTPEKLDGMLCIRDGGGTVQAATWDPDTRRRIVACLNACRSIPTEALEAIAAAASTVHPPIAWTPATARQRVGGTFGT